MGQAGQTFLGVCPVTKASNAKGLSGVWDKRDKLFLGLEFL